jgi:putative transposase
VHARRAAWQQCGVRITAAAQSAPLPGVKAGRPAYRAVQSQVLHDVLTRLDRAFPACFPRVATGEPPGSPRCHGATRSHSFTSNQLGNGAPLDTGVLVLAKVGRLAGRWSRPREGTPKTVTLAREAAGGSAGCSCERVPLSLLSATGQETGIARGLESFATLADGSQIATPRLLRRAARAVKRAQRRVSRRKQGSSRSRKAVRLRARAHQQVRRARADLQPKVARSLVGQ